MLVDKYLDKRLIALISLFSMIVFVFVSNIHTHDIYSTCTNSFVKCSCIECNTPGITTSGSANMNSSCPACEISNAGQNFTFSADTALTNSESIYRYASVIQPSSVICFYNNEIPSRAPPV